MYVPETEIIASKDGAELTRVIVRPGNYVIGRQHPVDLLVEDDSLSRRHAELTVNFDEILIEDLGSSNGTTINGKAVTECTRIWPNQKVLLGSIVLETRRVKAPGDTMESLSPLTQVVRRLLPPEFLREKKYEIGGVVANGAMGAILDAREVTTRRTVAMKVMLSTLSESHLLRFIEEAQITSQLEHPNIVPLHELGVDENDQVYYTMKLVKGITLKKVLDSLAVGDSEALAQYPIRRLLIILLRICDAIAFAHSKGVLHRDLKPENVMIGNFGEVLVMDWGLAKIMNSAPAQSEAGRSASVVLSVRHGDEEGGATMIGSVIGTPQYMSPEQASGEVELLDQRTDIYALGAMLYHTLALCPPVRGGNVMEILEKVRLGRITPFADAVGPTEPHGGRTQRFRHCPGGHIPSSLAAVAMRALSLQREDRYETVAAFRDEIDAYLAGFATSAEQAGILKQLALLIARHKAVSSILAACALVLLISGPLVFIRINSERILALKARAVAESERIQADSERQRAEDALAELRKAAPAYDSAAHALADEQKYPEALAKNDMAISLNPDNPDYALFHAHTLEAMQRLPEAVIGYERVLELRPGDPSATANMALCEALLRQNDGKLPLRPTLLSQLLDAVISEKRDADSVFLARAIGREGEVLGALFHTRLKGIATQAGWRDSRLTRLADHTFSLDLSDLLVPDLSVLKGLPISILNLARCRVADLTPISQMPLRELDLSESRVTNLAPLTGMQLHRLSIGHTAVTDITPVSTMPLEKLDMAYTQVTRISPLQGFPLTSLSMEGTAISDFSPIRGLGLGELNVRNTPFADCTPLKGMPLKTLYLGNTPVRDISALAGMPLASVELSGCSQLADLSPLAGCTRLQNLLFPSQVVDVAFLSRLPALQRISSAPLENFGGDWEKITPASQFFAGQGTRLARLAGLNAKLDNLRKALIHAGVPAAGLGDRIHIDASALVVDLDLSNLQLPDINCVTGLPLRQLSLVGSPVTDLSPLRGSPLVELDGNNMTATDFSPLAACPNLRVLLVPGCNVWDLKPLTGLKLQRLDIGWTAVSDLTPLQGMTTLQELLLAKTTVYNLAPIAALPLRQVRLDRDQNITDFSPLFAMKTLESLVISVSGTNVEPLRKLPALRFLSYKWDNTQMRSSQTAQDFWAARDRDAKAAIALGADSTSMLPGRKAAADEARLRLAVKPYTILPTWSDNRIQPVLDKNNVPDGTFSLDLSNLGVTDLSPFNGLPLSHLILSHGDLTSFAPLAGMPLVELQCEHVHVADWASLRLLTSLQILDVKSTHFSNETLALLRDKHIVRLTCDETDVTDISPLAGMPLQAISINGLKIHDLSPLASMPSLKEIHAGDCHDIGDFSFLTSCRKLEYLDVGDTDIKDLSYLKGLKLKTIFLAHTAIMDLSVLSGMPLERVMISNTNITDIRPLLHAPLTQVFLPKSVTDYSALRKIKSIQRISIDSGKMLDNHFVPSQTADEFWAAYDSGTK